MNFNGDVKIKKSTKWATKKKKTKPKAPKDPRHGKIEELRQIEVEVDRPPFHLWKKIRDLVYTLTPYEAIEENEEYMKAHGTCDAMSRVESMLTSGSPTKNRLN
jgi:hypothetical protein